METSKNAPGGSSVDEVTTLPTSPRFHRTCNCITLPLFLKEPLKVQPQKEKLTTFTGTERLSREVASVRVGTDLGPDSQEQSSILVPKMKIEMKKRLTRKTNISKMKIKDK